jgi:superfamily II DNA or RNA helicase
MVASDTQGVPRKQPRKSTSRSSAVPISSLPPHAIREGEQLFLLDIPYPERSLASAQGARWDSGLRASIFVGQELPEGLQPYASAPFSWERWQQDDLNSATQHAPPAAGTLQPRAHQREAAAAIARASRIGARGFLLADEVGTGKTISALEGVLALKEHREVRTLLIVSPLAVLPHWRRTVADLGLAHQGIRVCVINYDRLKKLLEVPASAISAKRTRTKNKRIAKEGKSRVIWDVVIFDEAHKLRNQESQRSQAAARIAGYGQRREDAPFVLWLSATIAHAPVEMSFLSPLLAQITGSTRSDLRDFGEWLQDQGFHVQYEPRFNKWSWTESLRERDADIAKIRQMLFTRKPPVAMRRLPTNLSGWPEVTRSLLPVDLSPAHRRLYREAWTQFRREMQLARRGKDPKSGMVARLRFRQKASLLRIDGTIEHTMDLLDNGHQAIIACQFLESLDQIREGLESRKVKVSVMDGRNPQSREAERLAFQRGETSAVLVTPVEGYSLHQGEMLADGTRATDTPRSLIVHDLRFSGIEQVQLEGRGHRDGKAAHVYLTFGADTVEEDIARVLLQRVDSMKSMVGDETRTIRELESLLEGSSIPASALGTENSGVHPQ